MPLRPGDPVCLRDPSGRVVGLRVPEPDDVVRVQGLGVIPAEPILASGYGGELLLGSRSMTILAPTPSLIASAVHHATQVIRPKDTGRILAETGIGAGSVVVEGGTGSGALTCALALVVGDDGHVYGHEPNDKHREVTARSLDTFGLSERVTLHDAGLEECATEAADAFVVDMPDPGRAVEAAHQCLAPGGRLAVYATHVTWVQDVVNRANDLGFLHVEPIEVLERSWVVDDKRCRPDHDMLGHTAFLVFGVRGSGE